mgnify:CR=1 FL=1
MGEFTLNNLDSYPLQINFAEVMAIENYLQNYQEDLGEEGVAAIPINRPATFSKGLLLKVASTYVELYDNRNDLDKFAHLACTEEELWTLRQVIPPNITFNNIAITPNLKKKILQGLITLNSSMFDVMETSRELSPTKYDVAEDIIEWRRLNP